MYRSPVASGYPHGKPLLAALLLLPALLFHSAAQAQCTPDRSLSGGTFPANSSHRCVGVDPLELSNATVEGGATVKIYAPQIRVTPTTTLASGSLVLLQSVIREVEQLTHSMDDDLTITLRGSGSYTLNDPTHGTLSGTPPHLTYTPNSGYSGQDHFSYAVDDGSNPPQFFTVYISVEPPSTHPLNDTGQTWGGDYPDGNNTTCASNINAPQDCHQGRDALAAAGQLQKVGDGAAGFDFTKLDHNGQPLPKTATSWSCVRDNHTGLIWEIKASAGDGTPGNEGLHDTDDRFTWYDTNPATNGGADGDANDDGAICHGYNATDATSYCNTQAFAARVNQAGRCGYSDWRLPNREELRSIVDYGRHNPAIDTDYFPDTRSAWFWSSSANSNHSSYAWYVYFYSGHDGNDFRSSSYAVRLVRGGQ